jgi:retron-type reverse transcriptase
MRPRVLATDYTAVYRAWQRFRKGKRPSRAIDEFAYNLEANIADLAADLTDRSYRHGDYQKIIVHEKKRRDLAVAGVRDRVVHRLLYDYLVDVYDKSFDPDVWSCRAGKGLHECLSRTQQLLRKYPDNYIWRADIRKFFDSVDHKRLSGCLERMLCEDDPALWICEEVNASYYSSSAKNSSHGIPIGNLTSQIFANIYLHEFDRFVRQQLKPQAYMRYGDDFLLFLPSRRQAYVSHGLATDFLRNRLRLTLNPKNDIVVTAASGLKFLGHNLTGTFLSVDKHTTKSILSKIELHNIASYRAMPLAPVAKNQLDWILLEKHVDI